jgi:hypothetical protein
VPHDTERYRASVSQAERCTWCGQRLERDEGYRAAEIAGQRQASFCRLEHVVPWAIQGPHWEAGLPSGPPPSAADLDECAQCGAPLDDARVMLVRHRGEYRIADAFCTTDHLMVWARSGGRYR